MRDAFRSAFWCGAHTAIIMSSPKQTRYALRCRVIYERFGQKRVNNLAIFSTPVALLLLPRLRCPCIYLKRTHTWLTRTTQNHSSCERRVPSTTYVANNYLHKLVSGPPCASARENAHALSARVHGYDLMSEAIFYCTTCCHHACVPTLEPLGCAKGYRRSGASARYFSTAQPAPSSLPSFSVKMAAQRMAAGKVLARRKAERFVRNCHEQRFSLVAWRL